ncbi:sulfurtransferase TusA family protein [Neobacillus sp. LXY-4]|uniref:sulfurtransferase TusA family protein n=1 Tax=Neobacillus sp. LXY-4 TaxID=3379826 RepID=UPI003EDE900F
MKSIKTNLVLDVKGLACPMPVVKTKKAMNELLEGQVLEIQATDKGSKADLKAWSQNSGHQYLGVFEEENVIKHFIRKATNDENVEKKHPNVATNEELAELLQKEENLVVLDVREEAEYAFNHIPNAVSIPLGELEQRFNELNKEDAIYVVCRTGSRSDFAAQILTKNGFKNVINVLPGMSEWTGKTTGLNN